jgi:hypothetical protein
MINVTAVHEQQGRNRIKSSVQPSSGNLKPRLVRNLSSRNLAGPEVTAAVIDSGSELLLQFLPRPLVDVFGKLKDVTPSCNQLSLLHVKLLDFNPKNVCGLNGWCIVVERCVFIWPLNAKGVLP